MRVHRTDSEAPAEALEGVFHHLVERLRSLSDFDGAVVESDHVEHVDDEPIQALGLFYDRFGETVASGDVESSAVPEQHRSSAENRCERRSHIV